jgi:hypothetical protein
VYSSLGLRTSDSASATALNMRALCVLEGEALPAGTSDFAWKLPLGVQALVLCTATRPESTKYMLVPASPSSTTVSPGANTSNLSLSTMAVMKCAFLPWKNFT